MRKRSKRLYVYWGVALALLIAAGLFCWLVVVPVWQVRSVLADCYYPKPEDRLVRDYVPPDCAPYIKRLGGRERAIARLSFYLRLPQWLAPHQPTAIFLLGQCGDPAVPVLAEFVKKHAEKNERLAAQAIQAFASDSESRLLPLSFYFIEPPLLPSASNQGNVGDADGHIVKSFLEWWEREGKAKYGRGE